MIKLDSDKNRYFPITQTNKQNKLQQNKYLKTEYSSFTLEKDFKNITSYIRLFESIQHKYTPKQITVDNNLFIPRCLSKIQKEHDQMIESRVEKSKISNFGKIMSEVVKQHKQHKKRYSCYDLDRSYQRHNWMQNIIRRKNNGSNGQIVRGLTAIKHDSLLQRFQAVSSYRQSVKQNPIEEPNEVEFGQKFIPLGLSQMKSEPFPRKNVSQLKGKKKMALYKRKSKISTVGYFQKNIKMKSQRNEKITKVPFQSSLQLIPTNNSRITKKLSEPYKIQRQNLGPWDAL